MAATYELDIDLKPGGLNKRIHLNQYDKGQTITIHLLNDDSIYTPVGSVWISGTKKDNTGFKYPCTVSGSNVIATVTDQMTCFYGDTTVEVADVKDGMVQGSANFILEVEEAALHDDVTISKTDIPVIQSVAENLKKTEQWKNEAAQSATKAANSQSAAKTSETNAANSASASANSAKAAKTSEGNAKTSETNAANSAKAAKTSETNAANSVTAAKTSENNAKTSETNAKASADAAKTSEQATKDAIAVTGYAHLYINRDNGHLILFRTEAAKKHLDFSLADHKSLMVTMIS